MLRIRLNHLLLLGLNCLLLMLLLSQTNITPNLGLVKHSSHEVFRNQPKHHPRDEQSDPHEDDSNEPPRPIAKGEDPPQHNERSHAFQHPNQEISGEHQDDNHDSDANNLDDTKNDQKDENQDDQDSNNDQQDGTNVDETRNDHGLPKVSKLLRSKHYKGGYCVSYDYWEPDEKWNTSITYVVHSTMPFIQYMQELVKVWNGPISIGVYVPAPNFDYDATKEQNSAFMEALAKFETFTEVKATGKVGLHLLFDRPQGGCEDFVYSDDQLSKDYEYLKHMYDHAGHIPNYPCQQLRNIARAAMNTRLFVASDIENIPAEKYVERMQPLAHKLLIEQQQKVVLVHRRFEVSELVPLPKTKAELKLYYDKGQAVEFHKIFYAAGHSIPFLDEWFNVPENLVEGSLFKVVPYTNGQWEPQFIADTQAIPMHDESFPYPHRGHTELGYETCRAGFEFAVVNDLFTLHPGIKTKASKGETQGVKHSQRHYLEVVYRFRRRMDRVYWKTKGQCGEFRP